MAWKRRSRRPQPQHFVMFVQQGLELLTDRRLGLQCTRVFLMLGAHMRWSGEVLVSQAQVGEALGMSRSNVHDAIERLIGYGLLQKTEKLGSLQTYRVSPFVAYRGRYVMMHMAQKQERARQHLEAVSEAFHANPDLDIMTVVR